MKEAASSHTVTDAQGGSSIDSVVRDAFALSWGRARELIRRGKILVDGQVMSRETTRVRAGATVSLDLAARHPRAAEQQLDASAIVFADAHVVVVDKPSGLSTVPYDPDGMGASIAKRSREHGEAASLIERVQATLAKRERARSRGAGGPPPSLGVVHRLDKETSGLLVFTRSWQAKTSLLQAFRAHTVHRRYLALVHGVPRTQTLTTHFVEDRGDGLRGSVERRRGRNYAVGSEKTQRAVTHLDVLEVLPGDGSSGPCALVACRLETGRTHQIRIHLSEAGHPVLGDRVYIRDYARREGAIVVPAPRVMLHAAELGFVHPATEVERHWNAELPGDMAQMLARLRGT